MWSQVQSQTGRHWSGRFDTIVALFGGRISRDCGLGQSFAGSRTRQTSCESQHSTRLQPIHPPAFSNKVRGDEVRDFLCHESGSEFLPLLLPIQKSKSNLPRLC